ncbi:hypothetical protein Efla_000733 [Eimeria flavescens]
MRKLGVNVARLPPVPARVAALVQRKIDTGDAYDAQQLVKTFSNRYKCKGEPAVSVAICKEFALQFASNGHGALALDLASSALQCMQEQDSSPSEEQLQLLADLLEAATQDPQGGLTAKDISTYVSRAVKWSRTPEDPVGSLLLHRAAAAANWRIKSYGLCQGHLVYCGDAEALGKLQAQQVLPLFADKKASFFYPFLTSQMEAWTPLGYPSEQGFFWLRLVLMLLCLKRVEVADELLLHHSGIDWEGGEVAAPLQLAYLTVAACRVKSIAAFSLLLRRYNILLRRDPFLSRCAEQIKLEVFGVTRQQPASLASLFSSLFPLPPSGADAA